MADAQFIPFDRWLRGDAATIDTAMDAAPDVAVAATAPDAHRTEPAARERACDDDALRDIRLFRARLADAFAAARDGLIHEFAYAVLGRELLLAPCDIAAIATRVFAEHAEASPLEVAVAPDERDRVADACGGTVRVIADAELAPGDAIVAYARGGIDARLGVRISAVLETFA